MQILIISPTQSGIGGIAKQIQGLKKFQIYVIDIMLKILSFQMA